MNARELMIGDLVKTSNNANWSEDLRGLICRVTYIGNYYIASTAIDNPGRNPYGNSVSFEPIPLTKEILEKNGFVYNDLPMLQYFEQYGLQLYRGGNGFRINCGINVSLIIDSVHQLQHALKLCGIEKEIII